MGQTDALRLLRELKRWRLNDPETLPGLWRTDGTTQYGETLGEWVKWDDLAAVLPVLAQQQEDMTRAIQGNALEVVKANRIAAELSQHYEQQLTEAEATRKHQCIRCHHRWEGLAGGELCGDCWRACQEAEATRRSLEAELATYTNTDHLFADTDPARTP